MFPLDSQGVRSCKLGNYINTHFDLNLSERNWLYNIQKLAIVIWLHFLECLATFPGMFGDIPRNIWGHSPECLATFPGMFEDIPQNVWRHSPECLRTFPGMFDDIPQNITFPSIHRVSRIPFPVPVFLVLYIAYWQFY